MALIKLDFKNTLNSYLAILVDNISYYVVYPLQNYYSNIAIQVNVIM